MVADVLVYRGYGDNGLGVFGHLLGTNLTYEITTIDPNFVSISNAFSQAGDGFVFRGSNTNGFNDNLVYSDGTGATVLLLDSNGNEIQEPTAFTQFGSQSLFLAVTPSVSTLAVPKSLLITNDDGAPIPVVPFPVEFYRVIGNTIYAKDYDTGDLHRIDSNLSSTLIYDRSADATPLTIEYMFEFQGELFFRAWDNGTNNDFYRVNPANNQITAQNIGANPGGDEVRFYFNGVGDTQFYFWNSAGGIGLELYVSDGTSGGTSLVEDINPGAGGSFYSSANIEDVTVRGDDLFFLADDGGADDEEIWVSDGTAAGTFNLSGTGTSVGALGAPFVFQPITVGTNVFFSAYRPDVGIELFVSDGTEAGTRLVEDINTGTGHSSPRGFFTDGTYLYFNIISGPDEDAVWVSDGTAAGTFALSDPGNGFNHPEMITIQSLGSFPPGIIVGTPGIDTLAGTAAADKIFGLASADSIIAGAGDDMLFGNAGNDMLFGGVGADVHNGGDGIDYARYNDANHGNVIASLSNNARNTGVAVGDTYIDIEGLIMGVGNDGAYGDAGDNFLFGMQGNDMLWGGPGSDRHIGGDGIDYARYDDAAYGDIVVSLANPAINTNVAAGDTFVGIEGLITGSGNDRLTGDAGNNYLIGARGNDMLSGGAGADLLNGGDGFDYARYDDADHGDLVVSLVNTFLNTGAAAGDSYIGIEGMVLGAGNDTGQGSGSADYIFGMSGNDVLMGQGGNDRLNGGAGNDRLVGGAGNDRLTGGSEDDVFVFRANYGRDIIHDFSGGAAGGDQIDLKGVFGSFNATLAASFQVGADVEIRVNASDVLVIEDYQRADLVAGDFLF